MLMTAALLAGSLVASVAAYAAADVKPAVIYDLGGKFDKSFNEGVFNGATKFKKETGIDFRDLEIQNEAQREQVLRKFAKDGFSPIMMPSASPGRPRWQGRRRISPRPSSASSTRSSTSPTSSRSCSRREEGSFLVGVIAAETSKTGKVGFVGGMDIPLISAFECGYAQGVKYASDGKDEVFANMTGTTPAAWNDPVKGGELAKSQIDRGADIVYAAAGATGQGVLKAAADAGKFGIGVDSDQNGLFPGKILTSMLKRVDVATYKSFKAAKDGTWKAGRPGVRPEGRRRRLRGRRQQQGHPHAPRSKAKADAAKADIISGKIKVHDYMSDNKCPV